mgnify:CR=1 FL=1
MLKVTLKGLAAHKLRFVLTAVAVAALTVYDMIKGLEKGARITDIRLVEKHGGRSGDVVLEG